VLGSDQRSELPKLIASDRRSGSDQRSLSLTLPDLNLTIFPSISCLVSGRRSEKYLVEKTAMSAGMVEECDGDDDENGKENKQQNKDGQRQ